MAGRPWATWTDTRRRHVDAQQRRLLPGTACKCATSAMAPFDVTIWIVPMSMFCPSREADEVAVVTGACTRKASFGVCTAVCFSEYCYTRSRVVIRQGVMNAAVSRGGLAVPVTVRRSGDIATPDVQTSDMQRKAEHRHSRRRSDAFLNPRLLFPA